MLPRVSGGPLEISEFVNEPVRVGALPPEAGHHLVIALERRETVVQASVDQVIFCRGEGEPDALSTELSIHETRLLDLVVPILVGVGRTEQCSGMVVLRVYSNDEVSISVEQRSVASEDPRLASDDSVDVLRHFVCIGRCPVPRVRGAVHEFTGCTRLWGWRSRRLSTL